MIGGMVSSTILTLLVIPCCMPSGEAGLFARRGPISTHECGSSSTKARRHQRVGEAEHMTRDRHSRHVEAAGTAKKRSIKCYKYLKSCHLKLGRYLDSEIIW